MHSLTEIVVAISWHKKSDDDPCQNLRDWGINFMLQMQHTFAGLVTK